MSNLQVDSIAKSYHGKVVLSDVYISCVKGQIKGLIGRNGSGKSTLLKIIFGSEQAEFKFIRINNKKVNNLAIGKTLIKYLPQDNFLPNNVSIKQLIRLFLPKEYAAILSNNQYMKSLLDKKNQDLSGGERRTVEILLILHSEADFILLDEPFNGLSPILRDYIIECLHEKKSTKGIIITDHDYERILKISDNIAYLQDGYLKEFMDKNELLELGYFPGSSLND